MFSVKIKTKMLTKQNSGLLTAMTSVTVFVFLLDTLPGFEHILNTTLQEITGSYINGSVSQCNSFYEDFIWNDIKKNNAINIDGDTQHSRIDTTHNEKNSNILDIRVNKDVQTDNGKSVDSLNNTFLVSIFETVFNITAQTCGGTLVSPYWVLTAASCVDLLSHLYNKNLSVFQTHYSVIANANNPLIDGTVHNVTEILFNTNSHKKSEITSTKSGKKIPSLALLKIEPPAKSSCIKIVVEKISPGIEVGVYGWVLNKDPTSGQDIMSIATFQAIVLESNDCKISSSFVEDDSTICLSPQNENDLNRLTMNSGGPVIISLETKMMAAVAQIDGHSNIAAYSLQPHYEWMMKIFNK